ncbi:DRMBL-domain-containing protein [Whalleya microplaca]|nr:DRMBL-domain-containing protein [Whalleya microplaca]
MPARTPRRQSKLNFGPAKGAKGSDAKTPAQKGPTNGNILNFFKKVEVEEQLFLAEPTNAFATTTSTTSSDVTPSSKDDQDLYEVEDGNSEERNNQDDGPSASKRRKLSHGTGGSSPHVLESESRERDQSAQTKPMPSTRTRITRTRGKGPFLEDSDSDDDKDDDIGSSPSRRTSDNKTNEVVTPNSNGIVKTEAALEPRLPLPIDESCPEISDTIPLKEEDSIYDEFKDLEEVEGLFDDDEFDDGEEFRERRYMEEQARLEAEEAGGYSSEDLTKEPPDKGNMTETCPLCNASLAGVSSDEATVHVNACLDGNPIPLPAPLKPPPLDTVDAPEVSKRFARAAVPRPGQANPISLGSTTSKPTSAFSKLMSGHAEDAAWASAAAAEHASRGKPAYKRTCPFYKIMPGFFICVDAFRYGAVKGCNAYFLSHFHSDHYIGLTANWSHGPIYCSKVTGSLVKNQLRTAAKWVKELEFEETVEIPGTEGATVTMLPANHCPGSSLFLFEKSIGKGPSKRTQRILHCGDFRACPAQVTHSLLKPDVIDTITGKIKQQKIDICYLDTTYLNPRYSFPPQDDVIRACAEFCKSLSGDPSAADEAFNALKREKGTTSVSQFFQKEESNNSPPNGIKAEGETQDKPKNRLLVICGTYSIGKERICKAIAQALDTKIFASPSKIKICAQLGDPELAALMTSDPLAAQVHMQMIMEIRAETLQDYLASYRPHFTRIVGFRPSGWNFRNPASTAGNGVPANVAPGTIPTAQVLHGPAWRTRFRAADFVAQRGSTRDAMCFGVPYSEHSSFRELALFLMALRIERVVPTVNVGSELGRRRMKAWTDRWLAERRKGGVVRLLEGDEEEGKEKDKKGLWDGKDGKNGGGVWW